MLMIYKVKQPKLYIVDNVIDIIVVENVKDILLKMLMIYC